MDGTTARFTPPTGPKTVVGWNSAPREADVWLLIPDPCRASGGWMGRHTGHPTGFAVLYDRDEDGSYESVGHVWTAIAWRRKGTGQRLLTWLLRRIFNCQKGDYRTQSPRIRHGRLRMPAHSLGFAILLG